MNCYKTNIRREEQVLILSWLRHFAEDFTFKVQICNDNNLLTSKIFEITFDKFGSSSSNSDTLMSGFSSIRFSEVSNENN